MQTVLIDMDRYVDAKSLHEALKRMLDLPDYYGMNADALYDCLSERREPPRLWITGNASASAEDALEKICQVTEDVGGSVCRI